MFFSGQNKALQPSQAAFGRLRVSMSCFVSVVIVLRATLPGSAPVCSPFSSRTSPLTIVAETPAAGSLTRQPFAGKS